jgi:hypothetical protein
MFAWIPCRCFGIAGQDSKELSLVTLSLAERLQDAPRPGATPKFTAEQRCQMAAFACETPAKAGRPISQWTGREIADEMKAQGIVEQMRGTARGTAARYGVFSRTVSATG